MLAGYLWAGGQLANLETKPQAKALTDKQIRDLKRFGAQKPKLKLNKRDEPFEIEHKNWRYWQLFLQVDDQFRWQSVNFASKQGMQTVLLRTGLDATAVISYLRLSDVKHPKRAYTMLKHIATGVKAADKEKLNA